MNFVRWGLWAGLSTELLLRVQSLLRLRRVCPHRPQPAGRRTVSPGVGTRLRSSTQCAQGDDRGRVRSTTCAPPRACASACSARLLRAAASRGHHRHDPHRTRRHLLSPPHPLLTLNVKRGHPRHRRAPRSSFLKRATAACERQCAGIGDATTAQPMESRALYVVAGGERLGTHRCLDQGAPHEGHTRRR